MAIDLIFFNDGILVFDVEHWIELRKTYRIIGEIIGNTAFVPSLPLKINPEEVLLLLDKGIVNVLRITSASSDPTVTQQKLMHFENELLQSQATEYKKSRRIQLESMLDKIVAKRRETGDTRSPEEILIEEIEKSTIVTKSNMIWPISLKPFNFSQFVSEPVNMEEVSKFSTKLKTLVYKDLWEKQYYITQGDKFGGDFLVYLGDPICHHAIFIVRCVESEQKISPSEIVAFGRLGTSVRKKAVLASLLDDKVSYVTINWIDA